MNIQGKVALITGASRGIGLAIAQALARQQIRRIILVARDARKLSQVAANLSQQGIEAVVLPVDLSDAAAVSTAIAQAWRDHGDIDLLINCAGVAHQAPFLRSHFPNIQREIDTNLLGLYWVTSLIARRMAARQRGTIVNVSSLMGKVAAPTMATYSATKFAIVGFTRALRLELAPHNIQVMTLLPTLTTTDMAKDLKKFRGVIPMSAEQVAQACINGLQNNASEVLVGWQSHLALWCDRLAPGLLDKIIQFAAPSDPSEKSPSRRTPHVVHQELLG
jgi:3-oxoacyl-[acyl-carrier protein] reductase